MHKVSALGGQRKGRRRCASCLILSMFRIISSIKWPKWMRNLCCRCVSARWRGTATRVASTGTGQCTGPSVRQGASREASLGSRPSPSCSCEEEAAIGSRHGCFEWAVLLFGGAILLAGMPAQALNASSAGQARLQGRTPAYASRPSPSRWHSYRRDSEGPGGLSKCLSSKKPCALAISSCKVKCESMGFALPLPGAEKRITQVSGASVHAQLRAAMSL